MKILFAALGNAWGGFLGLIRSDDWQRPTCGVSNDEFEKEA